jgi:hypothetical protein
MLIKQTFLTGEVQGRLYQHLLTACLTKTEFIVSNTLSGTTIVEVPIMRIKAVKMVRNILEFGIKVQYQANMLMK